MDVIVVDSKLWIQLNKRLSAMEKSLAILAKQQEQIITPATQGYISIKDAVTRYKISRVTISKKALKYKISRLQSGNNNLLKESELIEALKQKEPVPVCFSSEQSSKD